VWAPGSSGQEAAAKASSAGTRCWALHLLHRSVVSLPHVKRIRALTRWKREDSSGELAGRQSETECATIAQFLLAEKRMVASTQLMSVFDPKADQLDRADKVSF
jgi:hypothetical protein